MAEFRTGDCLVSINYKPDFLGRQIQTYQRDALGHPAPWWRCTHAECVIGATKHTVTTFSQTAPVAKSVERDRRWLEIALKEERPPYALFRFKDYSNVVTENFINGMMNYFAKELEASKNVPWYQAWFGGGMYDYGQLPMFWLNYIARKIGIKRHLAWLEIPGAEVCSGAVASGYANGFMADGKPYDTQFDKPTSEVSVSDFAINEMMMRTGVV